MQLINRKSFLPIVCCVYTLISIEKIIFELITGQKDPHYLLNFSTIFVFSVLATLTLSTHYYLQNLPLPIVIFGQYILLMAIIAGCLWLTGHITGNLASSAYRDMFLSCTIPYVIGAAIYYIRFHRQIKNANDMLDKIKQSERIPS